MRTLIIYYSLSGNTKAVCEAVARSLDADIEAIVETRKRSGLSGYLQAAIDAVCGRTTAILAPRLNPSDYDLLIIGTPVWVGNISAPVKTYIQKRATTFPRIAVVCTQGGSGADRVIKKIAQHTGRVPVSTLVVNQPEIEQSNYAASLLNFIEDLKSVRADPVVEQQGVTDGTVRIVST